VCATATPGPTAPLHDGRGPATGGEEQHRQDDWNAQQVHGRSALGERDVRVPRSITLPYARATRTVEDRAARRSARAVRRALPALAGHRRMTRLEFLHRM